MDASKVIEAVRTIMLYIVLNEFGITAAEAYSLLLQNKCMKFDELAKKIGISKGPLSMAIKKMREAGLVESKRKGRIKIVCLKN